MSDAFSDVATMQQIKQDIKDHEGKIVEVTLENGRKREKNKQGRIVEVYQSLFIVEYEDPNNTFVESYTYSDILTEKILIHYLD